jgi:hypothetical protein
MKIKKENPVSGSEQSSFKERKIPPKVPRVPLDTATRSRSTIRYSQSDTFFSERYG